MLKQLNKLTSASVICAVMAMSGGAAVAAEASCPTGSVTANVKGKAKTNVLADGRTLGVGKFNIHGKGPLTCSVHGVPTDTGYIHTLVCGDSVSVPGVGAIRSQLVLSSQFTAPPAFQSCSTGGFAGTFTEVSTPMYGRGIFSATGGGSVRTTGTLNCAGGVDMSMTGNLCVTTKAVTLADVDD